MFDFVKVSGGEMSDKEISYYLSHIRSAHPGRSIKSLNIAVDGDFVDLNYEFEPVSFERIRRITGYLVGTLDRWGDAKRAEERDRVRHSI